MKAGRLAGLGREAAPASWQPRVSDAGQFHPSHPSLWSLSVREEGAKGSRVGGRLSKKTQEEKRPKHEVLGSQIAFQRSLCILLGFREKRTGTGAGAGAWKEGAGFQGPGATPLGPRQRTNVQMARHVDYRLIPRW